MRNLIEKAIFIAGGQKALAEKCGVSQTTISFWKNGVTKKMPLSMAKKIEVVTEGKVTVQELAESLGE